MYIETVSYFLIKKFRKMKERATLSSCTPLFWRHRQRLNAVAHHLPSSYQQRRTWKHIELRRDRWRGGRGRL